MLRQALSHRAHADGIGAGERETRGAAALWGKHDRPRLRAIPWVYTGSGAVGPRWCRMTIPYNVYVTNLVVNRL